MSISPFSSKEISSLRELIERNNFYIHGVVKNYFRYSIGNKKKILIFTLKFPVELPIRLNVPFEVVSFRISLAFKLWNLDQKAYKVILYLMKKLKNLALQVSMEHNFPLLENAKIKLVKLLNLIIPDINKDENEKAWINRIRISLMNKKDQFKEFENKIVKNTVEILKKVGLEPTFKQPWEIENGIPKIRTSETLFFSNEEPEFFILEKGYFTYFKDINYKKFYIRTLFESYTPYILIDLFKDIPNFKINVYVENWIKFARVLLNPIFEIIDSSEIDENNLIRFRPEKDLDSKDFELRQNNFPFSALHYESNISKELYPLHNDLFNNPPSNFEVIKSIDYYTEAEKLIKKFNFETASRILEESLKIFNKYGQKKAIVSILLQLRKIASFLNQNNAQINYLQNALGIAKSGDVPIDYILKIHYELGKINFKLKSYNDALNHFNIIISFLKDEQNISDKSFYLGMANLYNGFIFLEEKQVPKSKIYFKSAFQIGNSEIKVKLKYYLLRAKFFKDKGSYSQSKKLLKMAISFVNIAEKKFRNIIIDLLLELLEIYIHHRKDVKKAYHYMKITEKLLSKKTIPGLQKVLRWNLLMSDFYKFRVKNIDKSFHYIKQSETLKEKLKKSGVRE